MPTNRKRKVRAAKPELTERQLNALIHNGPLIDPGDNPFKSGAEKKQAWKKNRSWIMSLIGNPAPGLGFGNKILWGRRPRAFYLYDCKEPFRKVGKGIVSESEFSYLSRNGLLLPGEKQKFEEQERKRRESWKWVDNA